MIGKKKSASAECPNRGTDWGVIFIIAVMAAISAFAVVNGIDTDSLGTGLVLPK